MDDESLLTVVAPPWSEGEDVMALDAAAEKLLIASRVAYVKGLKEGQTTLTLSAAGVSLQVAVTVTAPLPPETTAP